MQQTINYALKKIELTDSPPDITVINPNWDKIDEVLKALQDAINSGATDEELSQLRQDLATHLSEKASTTKAGHVQLNSATNSTDESTAATPKAVKTVNDNAESKVPKSWINQPNGVAGLDPNGKLPFDISSAIVGSYQGDNTADRIITLGFTPTLVVVAGKNTQTGADNMGFLTVTGGLVFRASATTTQNPATKDLSQKVVTNGFKVHASVSAPLNTGWGQEYEYVAFK